MQQRKPHKAAEVMKRQRETKSSLSLFRTELPLEKKVANYPRQSSKNQLEKNITSTHEQTIEQREWLKTLGWSDDMIIDYAHDLGTSGTLDIEDREGMTLLLADIAGGDIGAVCVFAVDRLFRDEYMLNVAYFIKVCAENNCLVITRYRIYDLNDRRDRSRFREDCERSWEDYEDQIVGKVLYYKRRSRERGIYDGRFVPMGLTVDYDKTSPYYKRYNIHPTHGPIIQAWFKRLVELDSWPLFLAEIRAIEGPHFPDDIKPATEGKLFVGTDGLKRKMNFVEGGWKYKAYESLHDLFFNVVYIGTWRIDDVVVEDNHPALIDKDTFYRAGEIIKRRSSVRILRPEDRVQLMRGVLTSDPGRCKYEHAKDRYRIEIPAGLKLETPLSIHAPYLDELFLVRLWSHIEHTSSLEDYSESNAKAIESELHERKVTAGKIAAAEEQVEGYMTTLSLPPSKLNDERREKILKKMDEIEEEIKRLKLLLAKPSGVGKLQELQSLCVQALELRNTAGYPIELMQMLMRKAIKSAVLRLLSPHIYSITVEWVLWPTEILHIYRAYPMKSAFTQEEFDFIRDNYQTMDLPELMARFPLRTYNGVYCIGKDYYHYVRRNPRGIIKYPNLAQKDLEVLAEIGIEPETVLPVKTYERWSLVLNGGSLE